MTTLTTLAPSKRSDLPLKLAIAVITPLLLVGVLEGFAYVWERKQANGLYAWELVASRRMEWEHYAAPGAGYTLMKPHHRYEWRGIPVEINSHGLRGPEVPREKPANTFRILNLGDSVAMGWGVREEETYGRRLESRLNARGDAGRRHEVINAGVPGWNLDNALAYLQAKGLGYEPDLILLDLTIVNDIYGGSAVHPDHSPALIQWLRANTYFWPFLTVQLRWAEARAEGRERIDVIDPPASADKYFPLDPLAERWATVWDRVLAMDRLAEANDAAFVLVLFPLEFQVLDEGYPTLPQDLFAARAAEAGIPVVDLLPAYRQACRERPGGACQREDRYLFADVWMHPSGLGHQLAAAEIERALVEALP